MQATFSVRMDKDLKKQFDELCANFGMTVSTAINIFAKAVVRERRIPFEISANETEISRKKALQIFETIRKESKENFPKGMSLKEINDEIALSRKQSK